MSPNHQSRVSRLSSLFSGRACLSCWGPSASAASRDVSVASSTRWPASFASPFARVSASSALISASSALASIQAKVSLTASRPAARASSSVFNCLLLPVSFPFLLVPSIPLLPLHFRFLHLLLLLHPLVPLAWSGSMSTFPLLTATLSFPFYICHLPDALLPYSLLLVGRSSLVPPPVLFPSVLTPCFSDLYLSDSDAPLFSMSAHLWLLPFSCSLVFLSSFLCLSRTSATTRASSRPSSSAHAFVLLCISRRSFATTQSPSFSFLFLSVISHAPHEVLEALQLPCHPLLFHRPLVLAMIPQIHIFEPLSPMLPETDFFVWATSRFDVSLLILP